MSDFVYPPAPVPARRARKARTVTLYSPDGAVTTAPLAETAPARQRPTLKELPNDERPRERLKELGPSVLNDAELLAILLRVGSAGETAVELASRLLREYGGLTGLSRVPFSTLCEVHGLGEAKVCQLKAALELGRRLLQATPSNRLVVNQPDQIGDLLVLEMRAFEQEVLRVVILNTKHQIMKMADVHKGSINSSLVRVAEVFKEAIRINGAAILVAHNHPSGDPTPSRQDVDVTEQIVAAGKLLDIDVLDHLIIGDTWLSLRSRSLGFPS
jgi:DNA repair protein RadC